MILFDGTHMVSDESLDELHAEAERIGLHRDWFQPHPRHSHYDVFGAPKDILTVNCTTRQLVELVNEAVKESTDDHQNH